MPENDYDRSDSVQNSPFSSLYDNLTHWLLRQEENYFVELFHYRSDVIATPPRSTADLAYRLLSKHSLRLALYHLNSAQLHYLLHQESSTTSTPEVQLTPQDKLFLTTIALSWTHPDDTVSDTSSDTSAQDLPHLVTHQLISHSYSVPISALISDLPYAQALQTYLSSPSPDIEPCPVPDTISSLTTMVYCADQVIDSLMDTPLRLTQKDTLALHDWKKLSKYIHRTLSETGWVIALLTSLHILEVTRDEQNYTEQGFLTVNPRLAAEWSNYEIYHKWHILARCGISAPYGWWKIASRTSTNTIIAPLHQHTFDSDIRLPLVIEALRSCDLNTRFVDTISAITWYRPYILSGVKESAIEMICSYLSFLGVIERGQLSNFGRILTDSHSDSSISGEKIAAIFPPTVHQGYVQSNGTIIIPGIPSAALSLALSHCAEVESGGMGTQLRISPERIIRSLKTHRTIDNLLESLTLCSATPIPSVVVSLFHDCARTVNKIKIGSAHSYIQCADAATLTEIMHNPQLKMHLIPLSPDSAISKLTPDTLAHILHIHSWDSFHLTPPSEPINPSRTPSEEPFPLIASDASIQEKINRALQSIAEGDTVMAAKTIPGTMIYMDGSKQALHTGMSLLKQAAAQQHTLKVEYLTFQGKRQTAVFIPLSIHQGKVTYHSRAGANLCEIAIHRIVRLERVET